MNLAWCVIALTVAGADDSKTSAPPPPNAPFTIEIKLSGPAGQPQGSSQVAKEAAAPDTCIQPTAANFSDLVAPPATSAKPDDPSPSCPRAVVPSCNLPLQLLKEKQASTEGLFHTLDLINDAEAEKTFKQGQYYKRVRKVASAEYYFGKIPQRWPNSPWAVKAKTELAVLAQPRRMKDPEAQEKWPMTLQEAIRIGVDNTEIVRVISLGVEALPIGGFEPTHLTCSQGEPPLREGAGPAEGWKAKNAAIVIARRNADASVWRFKAEVMAHVRSVEQQYWNLAQAQVQLSSVGLAVCMAQEILDREHAELTVGRGTTANVAEAAQRLEQFNLDLMTRTSDVITTERQLRFLLGLPPADNRRIIPTTKPIEELVEFDWDTCLGEMMQGQPDIVQQEILTRVAELQLLFARRQYLPPLSLHELDQLNGLGQQLGSDFAAMNGAFINALKPLVASTEPLAETVCKAAKDPNFTTLGTGFAVPAPRGIRRGLANTRQAQYKLLRSLAYQQQIVHKTTHALARFFLEVDANYKQYRAAGRLRAAAADRLEAQRAKYEEGRITIDRYLDAISQFTAAVTTEHQYLATYNICLAALSETKGTLLADRNIVVAEGPRDVKSLLAATSKRDDEAKLASLTAAVPVGQGQPVQAQCPSMSAPRSTPVVGPGPDPKPVDGGRQWRAEGARAEAKIWTFTISIGDEKPLQIKATISVDEPTQEAGAEP
jgi:outer membrane protein TolC